MASLARGPVARRSLVLLVVCGLSMMHSAAADELQLDARALLDRSLLSNVRLSNDETAVELEAGELFEDDGPAAGYSYLPNEESLSERVQIKKELLVPNPACRKATLLVAPGGDLQGTINGRPVELKSPGQTGKYWQAYDIDPDLLKPDKNEIVLFGPGKVWIARAEDFAAGSLNRPEHANRSARSSDGGKSWSYDRLGQKGDIDGEYYVRLSLDHYRPTGSLTLPVMDAGNLSGHEIAPPLAAPIPIRVQWDAEHGEVQLRIRSGSTAVPDSKSWTDWRMLDVGGDSTDPKGRFFQLSVEFSTADPLRSPRLRSLHIEADAPEKDDGSAKLTIIESHNEKVVRSTIPFAHEPFDHERLKRLRASHKLDEVVKGAVTELELIERLALWSASRWKRGHLQESYPSWDALEILKPHADGQPVGGFCQQYNVVFLQVCQSFGIPGRAVSIGPGDHPHARGSGHEVVELWSNQFRKWIYVDGNLAWYATDAETREPLSLWELRSRQLRVLSGKAASPTRIVHLAEGGKRWEGLDSWPWFLEVRLIPRSNFLEKRAPLPLNQGMRGWFWTGHHVWTDAQQPASLIYAHQVTDRRNWEWTLNQAHYTLEATPTLGELRVHLDTVTPGFETFLADIDQQGPKPVPSNFLWKLHRGQNRLEVRPRNIAGREGIGSYVVIEQP